VPGVQQPGSNAIATRLDRLLEQYQRFAFDDDARLLHWLFEEDEREMADLFLKLEAIQRRTGDLLLLLVSPFKEAGRYGDSLIAEMHELYGAVREALVQTGWSDGSWQPPPPPPGSLHDVHLLRTATSFREHHHPDIRKLVLVLDPKEVTDVRAFEAWMRSTVATLLDPDVRLVLLDRWPDSRLPVAEHPYVRHVRADLDMWGALEELNAECGDTPQRRYRAHFLAMGKAAADNDFVAAEREATAAIALCREHGWSLLVAVTHFTFAGGLLGAKRFAAAASEYRKAEHEARMAKDIVAGTLVLHAKLGQGAVCMAASTWPLGAEVYADAAVQAETIGDARMQLESLRMASYCEEQRGAYPRAWEHGFAALRLGNAMPREERDATTMPFLADALLRLTRQRVLAHYRPGIEQELRRLLGDDWQARIQAQIPDAYVDPGQPSALETMPPPGNASEVHSS
jgi:hypothetical protein